MRVIQLIDSLEPGGAERVAVNLANELAERIEWSGLCATRSEGEMKALVRPEVHYLFLEKEQTLDISAVFRLYRYLEKQCVDIIHAHSTSFFMAWMIKFLIPKTQIVWHDHYGQSEFLDNRPFKTLRLASMRFKAIISVNEQLRTWAIEKLNCKAVYFIPNFISQLQSAEPQTQLKGTDGKRIICLANLRPQKDHLTLISAFQGVHNAKPDWSLHLVGKDFQDAYSKELRDTIMKSGLKDVIHVYGSRPDITHILAQSDIGILSSLSEGLPMALLEYGLSGLAVISTNAGQCKWVIGDTGIVVQPGGADSMTKAILEYIMDPVRRDKDACRFQARVMESFSAGASLAKINAIYSN